MLIGFDEAVVTAIGPENDSPTKIYGALSGSDFLTRLTNSLYPYGSLAGYEIVLTGTELSSSFINGSNNLHVPSKPGSSTSVSIAH
jgi:hypothetical protein